MSNKIAKHCFVRPRPKQSLTASLRDVVKALKQPSQEKQETNSKGQEEVTVAGAGQDDRASDDHQPQDGTVDIGYAASRATDTDKKEAMLPPPPPFPCKTKIDAPPPKMPAKKASDDNRDHASTTALVHDGRGTHKLKGILKKSGDKSGPEDDEHSALVPAGGGTYDPPAAGPIPSLLPYPTSHNHIPYPVRADDGTWIFPMANDGMQGSFHYKHQLVLTPSAAAAANAAEAVPDPESKVAEAKAEPACIVCKGTKHLRDFSEWFGSDKAFMCYACFQHNIGAEEEIFWFNGLAVEG